MLIFLAQITVIPKEFYEAAEIDGANVFERDLHITIPLIRRAFLINVLFNLSFCLKMIEYPLNMTSGGPGNATLTLPLFMYYSMTRARQYGVTMASGLMTIALGAILMLVVLGVSKFAERRWA
jgi:ABC-type sugar transport system permease subunit